MYGAKPNLADLPDWGARVFIMKESSGKLDSKATEGRWLGYRVVSKGHRIYGPNRQIMVERNVTFENMVLQVPGPVLIARFNNWIILILPHNRNRT